MHAAGGGDFKIYEGEGDFNMEKGKGISTLRLQGIVKKSEVYYHYQIFFY